jgi:hypothetical protein
VVCGRETWLQIGMARKGLGVDLVEATLELFGAGSGVVDLSLGGFAAGLGGA